MPSPTSADAFHDPARVFEEHRHAVYGWAYRLVGRHHDAMDICQDVFLRWWRQGRGRADGGDARPWLRRVTINRAIDVLRGRSLAGRAEAAMAVASPGTSPTADRADALQQSELRADLAIVLAELSDAQRSVLVAKVFDGLTFAQIAREQAMAVPTAKTHYLRAVAALRDRLQRRWGPSDADPVPQR